jgi:ATP-dependent DNA helicase RecG
VPEATMMLITNAERFGLAQLHQLRWRIGRNDMQSYCFLETKNPSERLRSMEKHTDWFKLAELDLQFRGSGEILGTRQSGETDIPYEYLTDMDFMNKVKTWAQWLTENYPKLEWLPWLVEQLEKRVGGMMI